jgi:hypothetical protein
MTTQDDYISAITRASEATTDLAQILDNSPGQTFDLHDAHVVMLAEAAAVLTTVVAEVTAGWLGDGREEHERGEAEANADIEIHEGQTTVEDFANAPDTPDA